MNQGMRKKLVDMISSSEFSTPCEILLAKMLLIETEEEELKPAEGAVVWIEGTRKASEQKDMYTVLLKCGNCFILRWFAFPKGQIVDPLKIDIACENCGCKEKYMWCRKKKK